MKKKAFSQGETIVKSQKHIDNILKFPPELLSLLHQNVAQGAVRESIYKKKKIHAF